MEYFGKFSRKIVAAAFILSALAFIVVGVTVLFPHSDQTAMPVSTSVGASAALIVEVYDGNSGQPLPGVQVVVPETNTCYTTDTAGKTEPISVPVILDTHYADMLPMPWGEITLIAYSDGYIPYALFYVQVWENETRQGPRIYLFPENQAGSKEPFSIIEGPQRLWVNRIVDQYRPDPPPADLQAG
ncbi:MAG: hypothetical protein ACOYJC_10045 [Christensenellales bacterium]|jgi:hypothetical protein